jgi:hypothetical protein
LLSSSAKVTSGEDIPLLSKCLHDTLLNYIELSTGMNSTLFSNKKTLKNTVAIDGAPKKIETILPSILFEHSVADIKKVKSQRAEIKNHALFLLFLHQMSDSKHVSVMDIRASVNTDTEALEMSRRGGEGGKERRIQL